MYLVLRQSMHILLASVYECVHVLTSYLHVKIFIRFALPLMNIVSFINSISTIMQVHPKTILDICDSHDMLIVCQSYS